LIAFRALVTLSRVMKTSLLWVSALTWGWAALAQAQEAPDPNAQADAMEERLRTVQRGTSELRADVGASYLRLAAIEMSIFERVDGARITITQDNDVGVLYRLIEVSYAIDGESVFHRRDESGALGRRQSIEVHDGIVRPGDHTLSVVLRYVGDGREIVRYLDGYRFVVRSSYSFVAPPGQHTRVSIRAFERSADVRYEDRLGLGYERTVSRAGSTGPAGETVAPWVQRRE
jgi:hypothetical protein